VIVSDQDFTGIVRQFEDFAKMTGALAVHPYNDPLVMTGQGTVGLEIEQQLPELDTLFVSVGGGGLIGGITTWFGDRIKIVAVETEGTASLAAAYADGPDAFVKIAGISASSLGAPVIGCRAYEILTKFHVQSIVVPDAAVFEAQKKLWDCARIVAEPGAATALAPLTSGAYVPKKDERVGVLVCGGNAQPDWFLD
jgi:threonine dehydratase